ncbi:MAG: tetratricopeptide repeat protein [Prevotellaceae bacterium]|nr:tetratricopeptide repeat protein [Candidatus Minthosoma caballi]
MRKWDLTIVLVILSFFQFFVANAQSEKFNYIFQEAERQKFARNYDEAFDLFDYCLKLNPKSGAVMYELANLYGSLHNDSTAIKYLEKASELYPDNYWYKDNLVMLYFRNRKQDEALVVVEDMAQRFPDKTDVLMMLLDLYEKKRDFPNMVKVLDKVEVKEGKSEQLSMEKFRIFLQMNDEKRAFAEMTELAQEYPNDLRYQVVIGDLYMDEGKEKEALKQYLDVEQKDSMNVTLLLSLSNYYQQKGPEELYQKYLTKLATHPSLDEATRTRMLTGLVYENLGKENSDSTMLLTIFDEVLQLPQETTSILELKVRYMVTKQMPAEDVKPYLDKILEMDPENDMARQQLLSYAIDNNDSQGVIDVCRPAVEYKADDPIYYYYLGVGLMQMKKPQEAVDAFREGLQRVENGGENKKTLITNMYSLLGDIYHELGQDEKAYQAYDSCLIYKPDDATVLNNYAYYLSLNKKRLAKAEEMSRKAIEIEPESATYLDTYAWVLFQMKRYIEAKVYMDKVVELIDPEELATDSDIREHIEQINKKAK